MAKIPLKAVRAILGLSQEKLADKLKIARETVIAYENGYAEVKPMYLYSICYLAKISEDDVLLPELSTKNEQ
jgi:DNA-binding XRE family transcriptional regulator